MPGLTLVTALQHKGTCHPRTLFRTPVTHSLRDVQLGLRIRQNIILVVDLFYRTVD